MLLENFQGNYDDPVTFGHLFAVRQGTNESFRSYVRRSVHVKCQAVGLTEDSIIDTPKQGLLHGLLRRKLTWS